MSYRKSFEVIGYAYDADLHCVKCTEKRFPDGYKNEYSYQKRLFLEGVDAEGNEIHPIFLEDKFNESPVCRDCFEPIE